ncbi:hypothetical protein BDY19DRAFT_1062111 [Irpex rosettiformis]|uniref:Uncharacterized protein n=1 Tax=Irpex rosettiformis TaxID=378272 RepID=A0ACB8UJY3_9APHY|nr:hypothetical protein BDY19DRAFT_1062111 [Irpex rosettiformis]
MSIFQDQNGQPIKFFVQKDLPQEIQSELHRTVTALGGRIESKVPRVGFVLVQPGTLEEQRLKSCWASHDRPERFFVPYTFVDACKVHGVLLKQIFVRDGQPLRLHIDSSIANVNVRAALSQRILHSGGDPSASAQSAQVILADPHTEIFQTLIKTYQSQPDKYVESYLWVKECADNGELYFTPVVYKNPGGRRAGEERTHFTEEDETNLCNWIALKIPFKETGGRTGNRLYQQLVEMANHSDYSWVTRHTWQSWRERYKKNAARLDPKIVGIVERNKPALGDKGQYGYIRKPEEKPKKLKKKAIEGGEDNAIPDASKDELAFLSQAFTIPPSSLIGAMSGTNIPSPILSASTSITSTTPGAVTGASTISISPEVLAARQNASEEEDDENEWEIREGDEPPPAWAKRKASIEEEKEVKPQTPAAASLSTNDSQTGPLHVVDQVILDVARRFRFTVEEVKEYYDKCGDLNRTTNRFTRMREVLASLPDDGEPPGLSATTPIFKPSTVVGGKQVYEKIMKGVV